MAGLALRPYQDVAADLLYATDRAMVLAAVGAGKTAITITAMRDMLRHQHVKRWLVIAPKRVATEVWPVEIDKWGPLTYAVAVGSPAERKAAFEADVEAVIANFDTIQSFPPLDRFDGVVLDELTRLKTPGGKRFKALEKLIEHIPVRWGLTGSFTSNGLEDVYGQCRIIDLKLLGRSKGAFLQQYFVCINCDFGEWQPRRGSLAQIMDRIRPATYVLEPGEYADKLPPLHTVELRCTMADYAPYKRMKEHYVLELEGAKITAASAAAVTSKTQQLAAGFIYDSWTEAGDKPGQMIANKTPIWLGYHKFELLQDLHEENQRDNMIVVYNFREELAELRRRYPHAVTIDEPDAVKRWNDGKIELLLIHPMSAGHGLNLQYGGNKIAFLSLPWSLELYEQTVGRIHRGGQEKDVWCYHLICCKTIDERILDALQNKRALSQIALEELTDG